jgi:hypothetical protein
VLQRPDVEARLLEEAARVFGGAAGTGGLKPTYDQIHELKYGE